MLTTSFAHFMPLMLFFPVNDILGLIRFDALIGGR